MARQPAYIFSTMVYSDYMKKRIIYYYRCGHRAPMISLLLQQEADYLQRSQTWEGLQSDCLTWVSYKEMKHTSFLGSVGMDLPRQCILSTDPRQEQIETIRMGSPTPTR